MDSITQIVLGGAVGEVVLGKKVGNKAVLWGAVAGTIPDLDVLVGKLVDPLTALEIHRGFSHSIVFALMAAPIFGYIVSRIHRSSTVTWKDWMRLFFWGLFTHPLLDAHTTWGTQLFWPFEYRLAYKNIFVIDPLYTLPFLVCLILAMTKKPTNPLRKKYNLMGLLISSAYMLLTLGFKFTAHQHFKEELFSQQIKYLDVDTRPTPLNSILWTANVMASDSCYIGYYSLLEGSSPISFHAIPKHQERLNRVSDPVLRNRIIKLTDGWYTVEEQGENLIVNDLRFGQAGIESDDAPFVFRYDLLHRNGNWEFREHRQKMKDGKRMLEQLYSRILGN